MDRSVAVGATSGSFAALLVRLLTETLHSNTLPLLECPICPDNLDWLPALESLDPLSVLVGLLVGLLLGPTLDLLFLGRQAWRAWIRSRLAAVARQHGTPEPLYKLA